MKKLYYSTCGFTAPHIGVMIDAVSSSVKNGDDVIWAYCNSALPSCWINRKGKKGQCALCHRMYKEYIPIYGKGAKILPIKNSNLKHKDHAIDFSSPQDVQDFKYRNVMVGMSILSTYYTYTRDLDIKDFAAFKRYSQPLAGKICDMIDYCYQLLEEEKPDEVYVFNGRHFSNHFFPDICKYLNIPFTTLEVAGGFNDPPFRRVSYKNHLPHSIKLRGEIINNLWEISKDTQEKKEGIAKDFYSKRRNGDLIADVKAYVASQKKGLLPEGFDHQQRNVAIFNSSADEFAAIGGEWNENLLFQSQYEAIKYMLENSSKDIHYYLRVHPNLAGINHKAHLDLYKLGVYDNITIIKPEEKISTYALLDECEKNVTFGSTMGVESCYWGKPSIMIGHSYYETLNVCYIPKTREELVQLLEDRDIKPLPKDGAIKYAYYLLDRKYLAELTSIDLDIREKKVGIVFPCTPYLKIWGQSWLFQLAYLLLVRLSGRINEKKY